MKSGMIASEVVFDAITNENYEQDLLKYEELFQESWINSELYKARNWGPLFTRISLGI